MKKLGHELDDIFWREYSDVVAVLFRSQSKMRLGYLFSNMYDYILISTKQTNRSNFNTKSLTNKKTGIKMSNRKKKIKFTEFMQIVKLLLLQNSLTDMDNWIKIPDIKQICNFKEIIIYSLYTL